MKTPMTHEVRRSARLTVMAFGVVITLALSMPAAACSLDGRMGPGHAAFGGWAQLNANRHMSQSPLSGGNRDSGDSSLSGGSIPNSNKYSEEDDTEDSEPLFDTLPGPVVDVRERGGSIAVEELRDEEPIDLRTTY
jgi:hypothetical protein